MALTNNRLTAKSSSNVLGSLPLRDARGVETSPRAMADRAKPESTFSVNFDTSIASSAPAPSRPRRPAGRGDRGAAGDGGGGRGARAVAPAVSDVANVSDLDGFDLAEPDAIVAGSLARRSSESDTESSVPVQAYGRKPPVWSLSAMQHRHTIREGGDTAEKLFQELLQSSQAALEAAEREKFDAISRAEEAERASAASSERERRLLRASGGGGGGGAAAGDTMPTRPAASRRTRRTSRRCP